MPKRIDELYGLKVAVVDHYAPHELLIAQHPDLTLLPLPSVAAAYAGAGHRPGPTPSSATSPPAYGTSAELKLNGLEISGETPYRYQLAMAVPRGQPILAGIVDKVLADLSAEEIEATPGPPGSAACSTDVRPGARWRPTAFPSSC